MTISVQEAEQNAIALAKQLFASYTPDSIMATDTPKRVRFEDETAEAARPNKAAKTVRGISRLQNPTVVLALGFAVGTTHEDIRQALIATNEDNSAQGLPPRNVRALRVELLSKSPKVLARLIYGHRAAAEDVAKAWHGVVVDGNVLMVWVADDAASNLPSVGNFSVPLANKTLPNSPSVPKLPFTGKISTTPASQTPTNSLSTSRAMVPHGYGFASPVASPFATSSNGAPKTGTAIFGLAAAVQPTVNGTNGIQGTN